MNDICVLVPTHPPHFHYALRLKRSFENFELDLQADLCFVYTRDEEKNNILGENAIILPKSLRHNKNGGIINIKKFYGLMKLKRKYKYIIVLDDDTLVLKKCNLMKICNEYFQNKVLIGSIIEGQNTRVIEIVNRAKNECKKYFRRDIQNKISTSLSLWFNQLCIYRSDDLTYFFKYTELDKKISGLTYFDFDYLIYMYYLIAFCGFKIKSCGIASEVSAAEITSLDNIKFYTKEMCQFYALTEYMQKRVGSEKTILTLHVDREVNNKKVYYLKSAFFDFFSRVSLFLKLRKKLRWNDAN